MLDEFIIFNKFGLVLFRKTFAPLKGDPIGSLLRTVLIENRETSAVAFNHGPYAIKYILLNKHSLIFAAVYQAMLQPLYVDLALENISRSFCRLYADEIEVASGSIEFSEKFEKLLWDAEEITRRRPLKPSSASNSTSKDTDKAKDDEVPENSTTDDEGTPSRTRPLQGPRGYQGRKKKPDKATSPKATKAGKEARNWDGRLTDEQAAALDVAGGASSSTDVEETYAERSKQYLPEEENSKADIDKDDDDADDIGGEESWSFSKTALGNFFAGLTGQKPLSRADLTPALEQLEKQLLIKNVSTEAAKEIVEAVAIDLEGKKLGSFTRGVHTAVRESCFNALQRLLTPKRSIDILRDARNAKAEGRPYSIVFIGVNGVGKSTSLSKVCYYLKQNGLNVMICACDTFRSGAVEQLKVHSRNLKVHLFEQGYNKDAASVASNGIKYAKSEGYDVVLIDTAGRMQNNEPLMRQLTRLIATNRPDLILFVGEALVGNDGRDQLILFDKALVDYSSSTNPRRIDGMMLTKFDTIDDKVGAAVSMVHSTGQPIIFVGTGQKYTNLNRLNVNKVVKALLSN